MHTSLSSPAALLTTGDLQAAIHQALDAKYTGRICIRFQADKTLTLFIHSASPCQTYIRNHRVPDRNWELPLITYGEGALQIQPAPARALMFMKIVLEELNSVKLQSAGTNQLATMFDLAERNPFPTLFHVHWASAEGFVLIAGRNI